MTKDDERAGDSAEGQEAAVGDRRPDGDGAPHSGVTAAAADPSSRETAPGSPAPPPPTQGAPRPGAVPAARGGGAIAWLAVLLALIAVAAAVWGLLESERRQADLLSRVSGMEAVAGRDGTALEQLGSSLERQLELQVQAAETALRGERQDAIAPLRSRIAEVAAVAAGVRSARGDDARAREAMAGRIGDLEAALGRLRDQLDRQGRRLEEFRQISSGDRDSWLLAEAHYLLRLANQRLLMAGDTASATALLRSADGILRDLDEAALRRVREAVAADLAAVRAVPALDREGTYLRLGALIDAIAGLRVFDARAQAAEEAPAAAGGGWQARLRRGYEEALAKLSGYITVTRRDEPVEVLMDPQWEQLVRQNLRMLLEQSQIALLSGNGRLYRESVERAAGWVEEFRGSDPEGAAAMIDELEALAAVRVSVDVPDAANSLAAMRAALAARGQRGGSESDG